MSTNLPTREYGVTPADNASDRYRWALTGPAGVVEFQALDVLPLGRAVSEHLGLHSPRPWADAEEYGECPMLAGENGHCASYDLAGDKLARAWNVHRDDTVVWARLGELYAELPATDEAPAVTA